MGAAATTVAPNRPPATLAPATTRLVAPTTSLTLPTTHATAGRPSGARPSPDAVSGALIDDWEHGRRLAARTIATPAAVAALFEKAYAGQVLNDRGCSDSFQIVCSWGPYAGAVSTEALYEIWVAGSGASWYVSAVTVEN